MGKGSKGIRADGQTKKIKSSRPSKSYHRRDCATLTTAQDLSPNEHSSPYSVRPYRRPSADIDSIASDILEHWHPLAAADSAAGEIWDASAELKNSFESLTLPSQYDTSTPIAHAFDVEVSTCEGREEEEFEDLHEGNDGGEVKQLGDTIRSKSTTQTKKRHRRLSLAKVLFCRNMKEGGLLPILGEFVTLCFIVLSLLGLGLIHLTTEENDDKGTHFTTNSSSSSSWLRSPRSSPLNVNSSTYDNEELFRISKLIVQACAEEQLFRNITDCQHLCKNRMCCFDEEEQYNCESDLDKSCVAHAGCAALIGFGVDLVDSG